MLEDRFLNVNGYARCHRHVGVYNVYRLKIGLNMNVLMLYQIRSALAEKKLIIAGTYPVTKVPRLEYEALLAMRT